MDASMQQYLEPTPALDFDHPAVADFAARHGTGLANRREQAVSLYMAVRDGIQIVGDGWGTPVTGGTGVAPQASGVKSTRT